MAKDISEIEPQIDGLAAIIVIRNKIDSLMKLSEAVQIICKRTEDSKVAEWIIRLHEFSNKEQLSELTGLCDQIENYLRQRHELTTKLQAELLSLRKDAAMLGSSSMEVEFEREEITTVKPKEMTDHQWINQPLQTKETPF